MNITTTFDAKLDVENDVSSVPDMKGAWTYVTDGVQWTISNNEVDSVDIAFTVTYDYETTTTTATWVVTYKMSDGTTQTDTFTGVE